jgi:cell division protein FtsB
MDARHQLRKQVRTELKLRQFIYRAILVMMLAYFGVWLLSGDTGLLRYFDLRETREAVREEVETFESRNAELRASVERMRQNDFYVEKHAREEFGMAGKGEIIFLYPEPSR